MKKKQETLTLLEGITQYKVVKKKIKGEYIEYINLPCSMDTETTSFINDLGEKCALMYIHQWDFDGHFIYGRTWEEFREIISACEEYFNLNLKRKLVIYVHNLPFEFQFFRKEVDVQYVFATGDRTPAYVEVGGIEFRDSLVLSGGKSLAKIGEEVGIPKLKGDLDYDIYRSPETPISDEEMQYCINDVKILTEYIRKKMETDGDITKIPMTNTGYVRRHIRKACFSKGVYRDYKQLMTYLTLEEEEYKSLKRAFQGGFTHANARMVGKTINEPMESWDFTSSYPAVMLSEQFPMSRARKTKEIRKVSELKSLFDRYCVIFNVKLRNVELRDGIVECPISSSKCWDMRDVLENNGRIAYASELTTTCTEVDYLEYEKFYKFEVVGISDVYCYKKGYLPKPIIESVLKFYELKTTLKDVEGEEEEYQLQKGMLNSCYGMIVMDIVREEINYYNDDWHVSHNPDARGQIEESNESTNRFLFYPWGVYITAYARRNLFSGILEAGEDYVYADTDSCKILNPEKHHPYFERYNCEITNKIEKCLKFHNIEYIVPSDIKGKKRPLGVWDFDGSYDKFKTLGAKRYIYHRSDNNKNGFTVAGIPKSAGIKALTKENGELDFEKFNFQFMLEGEESEKLTHSYIDVEREGIIIDYLGNSYEYKIKSGLHLGKTTARITISDSFFNYLKGLTTIG